jgi:hypothetical protein
MAKSVPAAVFVIAPSVMLVLVLGPTIKNFTALVIPAGLFDLQN